MGLALLVIALCVVSFLDVIFEHSLSLILFRAGELFLVLAIGINLLRVVIREIEQKDIIQTQELKLEMANRQQTNLLHFISHEIKAYLANGQTAFAGIVDGDYGPPTPEIANLARNGILEMHNGVETVMDILDASNFNRGFLTLSKEMFDLVPTIKSTVQDLKPFADEKGIALDLKIPDDPIMLTGDQERLKKNVFRNLVDNAIRYTPSGSISVSLEKTGNRVLFTVHDTGIGITEEDKGRLFTEGGFGKNSRKINVHSTGYGLYIAKQMVIAHDGTIQATSDGEGKGATFTVELPLQKAA